MATDSTSYDYIVVGSRLSGRDRRHAAVGGPAHDIIALARSPEKAAGLGIEVREADYDRPEMLEPALRGVDTLLLISASEIGKRAAQHHNVIEAAKRSDVKRIVYTSLLHADTSPIGLAGEHRATEEEIKASGVPYTILRNGWYTKTYTSSIPGRSPEVPSSAARARAGSPLRVAPTTPMRRSRR